MPPGIRCASTAIGDVESDVMTSLAAAMRKSGIAEVELAPS